MKLVLLSAIVLLFVIPSGFAELADSEPEWYLPTGDGCRLFVQEFGHGNQTIVVLHGGWGGEHSYLLDVFKGLEPHYHLVFYDQRGSLRSPCSAAQVSVEKHIADLERLRNALNLDRINIVAHSMGTFLAMDYLQHYPARVKGLVLLGALPPRTPRTDAERALWKQQDDAGKSFTNRPEIAAEQRKEGFTKDDSSLSPKEKTLKWHILFGGTNVYHVERWRQMKGGQVFYNGEIGGAAAKTMPQEYDFTPALAAHACPVWFIMGDHDYVDMGAKILTLVSSTVPNMRVKVLKDAGHAAWIDAPQQFRAALLSGLETTTHCADSSRITSK